jgi:CHAT domain-containing protein
MRRATNEIRKSLLRIPTTGRQSSSSATYVSNVRVERSGTTPTTGRKLSAVAFKSNSSRRYPSYSSFILIGKIQVTLSHRNSINGVGKMRTRIIRMVSYVTLVTLLLASAVFGQTQPSTEVQELLPSQVLERQMAGGEIHRYHVSLRKDEYFKVNVDQKSVNVSLRLYDGDQKALAEADNCLNKGAVALSFVADTAGSFFLEVKNVDEKAEQGIYVIQREPSRGATPADRAVVVIQREQQARKDQLKTLVDKVSNSISVVSPSISEQDFQRNLSGVTEALEIARSTKCKEPEGAILFAMAVMYGKKEDSHKALEYYEETLKVINTDETTKKSLRRAETIVLRKMGKFYQDDLGDSKQAVKLYYRALALYREKEEDENKGLLLQYLGKALTQFRSYPQAEESFLKAIKVFKNLKLQFALGAVQCFLGRMYSDRGDKPTEALKYLLEAESNLENSPIGTEYQTVRAFNLSAILLLYKGLHDREKTSYYKNKLKEMETKSQDPNVVFTNKWLVGEALLMGSHLEEALTVYQEALEFAKKSEAKITRVAQEIVLQRMIRLYLMMGRYKEAKATFDKAYDLVKGLNDHTRLAFLLESFGNSLSRGKAYELAVEYYGRALSVLMSKENRPKQVDFEQIAVVQHKWGMAQFETGDHSRALINLRTSLLIQMSLHQQTQLQYMLQQQMDVFARLNRPKLAIFVGKQSIMIKQQMRRTIKTLPIDTQKTYLSGNRSTYEKLVALLLQERRFGEAIQVINLSQDQEFYDFGNNDRTLNKAISLTERESSYLAELERLQSSMRASREEFLGNPDLAKLDELLQQIEVDFSKAPDERDNVSAVIDLTNMQTLLSDLGTATKQKTASLYTLISEDKLHVILITPVGEVKAFETSIKTEDLNEKILDFYALLQSPKYDPRPLGKELYDIILKPLEAELRKWRVQTLMWQLDGNLRYIPMAALWDGRKYLVERYQSVVFTRANRERMTASVTQHWTGAGFGSSQARTIDLLRDGDKINFVAIPGVTAELQSIFRSNNKTKEPGILNGEVFLDESFTRSALYEALKRRRPLVHISSHFAFRPGDDSRSFLLLGDGTALTLSDIKAQENLFAGVELLTLSACNTAATQSDANGKEIDGFAELAQRLGASAVMATLWQVSDSSTPWLMKEFYATRQSKSGTTKSEALRYAQLALLNGTANTKLFSDVTKGGGNPNVSVIVVADASKQTRDLIRSEIVYISQREAPLFKRDNNKLFAHPYYWSPFVLYGNWR